MSNMTLDELCVNTIRTLAIDGVQKANSGHPGMPMGMADAAYVLWTQFLRHNPKNPDWFNRDRFILSAGHGSMLLYSLLHLTGYDLPLDQLKQFRQWNSLTPGHPEHGLTPGVETTTGPLGQGFANGVGMAIAEAFMAATFNRDGHQIVDHYIYAIVSDGDLMEGISHEAASMAGHMKLGKIIYLYDDNHISIDGSTDLAFTEDRMKRFEAYHWHTQQIDGHDRAAVAEAIKAAQAVTDKPSIIACRTTIGFGSPHKANTAGVHGSPLGEEEVKLTKAAYGWDYDEPFYIPDEALAHFREAIGAGAEWEADWKKTLQAYEQALPQEAKTFRGALSGELPEGWDDGLPVFPADAKGMATRAASGKTLNAIAPALPTLIGGSADLAPSNNTMLKDYSVFDPSNNAGRNFHFGVREHAMVGALNGMALHGGVIPYGGTFLVFSDYCRPSIRLAALSHIPITLVFTHDSIGLGEDGPTHQPVEHLAALRAIPHLTVIRPADANETAQAWKVSLEKSDGPVALILTRQSLPVYDRSQMGDAANLSKGAYVLLDTDRIYPDVLLIATGSEVQFAVEAHAKLAEQGIGAHVISMPSWELFEEQSDEYKEFVLPSSVKARVAIEAGISMGWQKYVGPQGTIIGLDRFGASAPYKEIYEHLGFTTDNVVLRALETIDKSKK
ncbi:MAG: transketolase [Anaerolineae bacterium]|nr:transketolase [Anaerolineae bacterium]MCB9106067.1 transketolase [Anaerolineales bacterium]